MSNLSSPFHLFLNPSRIQIRTQFSCGPSLLPLLAHLLLFSPFSLTLLQCFSTSLSCSQPLQSPYTAPFLSQTPIKKNIFHISVKIQKTQQNPTQHHHTQITDQDLLGIGKEIGPSAWLLREMACLRSFSLWTAKSRYGSRTHLILALMNVRIWWKRCGSLVVCECGGIARTVVVLVDKKRSFC
jgi:hypothetical protein